MVIIIMQKENEYFVTTIYKMFTLLTLKWNIYLVS